MYQCPFQCNIKIKQAKMTEIVLKKKNYELYQEKLAKPEIVSSFVMKRRFIGLFLGDLQDFSFLDSSFYLCHVPTYKRIL